MPTAWELAEPGADKIGIRDSKHPEDGHFTVRPSELAVLLARIQQEV
ncbi:DUF397 domain-containing protein [Spirillospora sp. NPDC052269]